MADKIPPRFRKTKSDKWAVMAPLEDLEKALAEGGKIEVQRKSGDWGSFTVGSLGRPFEVDGVQMCYGYAPEDDEAAPSDSAQASNRQADGQAETRSERPPNRRGDNDGGGRAGYRSGRTAAAPPPPDPSEPLPEYQGGPEDEWDGFG
jgi:hypothetical protein